MKVESGSKKYSHNGVKHTAIIHFKFEKFTLYVFKGQYSQFDILVRYDKDGIRLRTPKHIHWAVDLLIKRQENETLTKEFLTLVKNNWINCVPLKNNDFDTLEKRVNTLVKSHNLATYEELNAYGEYPVDFLFVLMSLLSIQEKTNRPDAYMFGQVIDELLKENVDIYKIISSAGYRGGK